VSLLRIGLFSGTVSISSQITQCRIILLLQPITKLYLFTIELKLRDDFRCFRSTMCFRTFSTVPLNSPIAYFYGARNSIGRYTMTGVGYISGAYIYLSLIYYVVILIAGYKRHTCSRFMFFSILHQCVLYPSCAYTIACRAESDDI